MEPSRGLAGPNLRELWDYRELLFFLAWRDIKARYQQTVLGAAWAILQPLMTMLIFTLVFSRVVRIPSDGIPYPLFALAGVLPWSFFASSLTHTSMSIVSSANMVKKVYFPRLAIPVATCLASLVDLMCSFSLLAVMMAWYKVTPTIRILWLPAFVLLALVSALGVGLWMSALNVKYRDVKHLLPFAVQFWMYATPIVYPSSLLKGPLKPLFSLNPMAGVVEGFRWCLVGGGSEPGLVVAVSAVAAVTILITGLFYFRSAERHFADLV